MDFLKKLFRKVKRFLDQRRGKYLVDPHGEVFLLGGANEYATSLCPSTTQVYVVPPDPRFAGQIFRLRLVVRYPKMFWNLKVPMLPSLSGDHPKSFTRGSGNLPSWWVRQHPGGFIDFMVNPNAGGGLESSAYHLGEHFKISGCWSSRAGAWNKYANFCDHLVAVDLAGPEETISTHILLGKLAELLDAQGHDYMFHAKAHNGEVVYFPHFEALKHLHKHYSEE